MTTTSTERLSRVVMAAGLLLTVAAAPARTFDRPADTQPTVTSDAQGDFEHKQIGEKTTQGGSVGILDWVQPVVALAIVVALIFLLRWVLIRLGGRRAVVGRSSAVEVLARGDLAPRCRLFVLRLGRRVLLVGAGPNGPATLCEVTDPAEAAELLALMGKGEQPASPPGEDNK